MSLNGIEARSLLPAVGGDLEDKRIVNLKEKLDPPKLSELQTASKTYLCNSRLRSPGDSLCKYGINSVEIYDSIAECISDAAARVKRVFNSLMPVANAGVEGEPSLLASDAICDWPGDGGVLGEGVGRSEVIGAMDEPFERIVKLPFFGAGGFVVAFGLGEFGAEEILAVHEVDGEALAESFFELGIIRLPCHHLSICTREIRINYYLASVGDEHFADVGKPKLRGFLRTVGNDRFR